MIAFSTPSAACATSAEGETTPPKGSSPAAAGAPAAASFQQIFAATYSDNAASGNAGGDRVAGEGQPAEFVSAGDPAATKHKAARRFDAGDAGDMVRAQAARCGNGGVRSRGAAADDARGDFSLRDDSSLPAPAPAPLALPDKTRLESLTTPAPAPDKEAVKAGGAGNPAGGLDGLAFGLRVTPAGARPGDSGRVPAGGMENQSVITPGAGSSSFAGHLQALTSGLASTPGTSGAAVSGSKEQFGIVAPLPGAVLTNGSGTTANRSAAPNAPATATATESPGEAATATGEPVRNVHVQLAGSGNQVVDLRLTERDGSLAVSVRSSDGALTRALQDQLPELNARLTEHHYATEVWTPATTATGNLRGGDDSGAGAQQQFSPGPGSHGGQAGQRQGNQPRHQSGGGEADEQPAWRRQLAAATNQ